MCEFGISLSVDDGRHKCAPCLDLPSRCVVAALTALLLVEKVEKAK